MRRRRRSSFSNNSNNYYNSGHNEILLTEFKFFNSQKEIISNKILLDIENKINSEQDIEKEIYWTNEKFLSKKIGFSFYLKNTDKKNNQNINNSEIYIKIIEYNSDNFNVADFCTIQKSYHDKLFLQYIPTDKQDSFLRNNYRIFNDYYVNLKYAKLEKNS